MGRCGGRAIGGRGVALSPAGRRGRLLAAAAGAALGRPWHAPRRRRLTADDAPWRLTGRPGHATWRLVGTRRVATHATGSHARRATHHHHIPRGRSPIRRRRRRRRRVGIVAAQVVLARHPVEQATLGVRRLERALLLLGLGPLAQLGAPRLRRLEPLRRLGLPRDHLEHHRVPHRRVGAGAVQIEHQRVGRLADTARVQLAVPVRLDDLDPPVELEVVVEVVLELEHLLQLAALAAAVAAAGAALAGAGAVGRPVVALALRGRVLQPSAPRDALRAARIRQRRERVEALRARRVEVGEHDGAPVAREARLQQLGQRRVAEGHVQPLPRERRQHAAQREQPHVDLGVRLLDVVRLRARQVDEQQPRLRPVRLRLAARREAAAAARDQLRSAHDARSPHSVVRLARGEVALARAAAERPPLRLAVDLQAEERVRAARVLVEAVVRRRAQLGRAHDQLHELRPTAHALRNVADHLEALAGAPDGQRRRLLLRVAQQIVSPLVVDLVVRGAHPRRLHRRRAAEDLVGNLGHDAV